MYNPFSLKGKKILITGASSGLGRSIAIECSKMGASVIITGRNKERLQETFDNLTSSNNTQIICDLTNKKVIYYEGAFFSQQTRHAFLRQDHIF